ncbi:UDP-N-acetylmuramoyl-L-alanyl-D-glutamate--2,6-diaminopimelate ligase [Desulfogranum japonicum]|uniref:UDP-N-acetylmuramoyl-L-alanyl-D-glutamate--2, 6-diaminopimelate ligase n=1 Tax=Desulfogranum japonicum TaxID=231447 RepID=UPI00048D37B3|nr:UDP-N-acetylmuramoyl-L-alanyl-D-glutamate--2,6-diaminopimelate ligase [Desulfogranum japonicum]
MKNLTVLLESIEHLSPMYIGNREETTEVRGLIADSRKAQKGDVFVALKGSHCDGHDFVNEMLALGCSAVVVQRGAIDPLSLDTGDTLLVTVPDTYMALAEMAAAWYDYPASQMVRIGITGTNGKTTCTWLIEEMLVACGYKTGVIGTVNYRYRDQDATTLLQSAPMTTPDPLVFQRTLKEMADNRVTHLIMEVSSHALHQSRIGGMQFDVAVFTNLSWDHLDYHHDMEEYFQVKSTLFTRHLKEAGYAVVVTDENAGERDWAAEIAKLVPQNQLIRCGLHQGNDIFVSELKQTYTGSRCTLHVHDEQTMFVSPLTGRFNMRNIVASVGVGVGLGFSLESTCTALQSVQSVPGRFERVSLAETGDADQPAVFIDYAHTPDALLNVLETARALRPRRLICVFGCGGDRDRGKRPEMGKIVGEHADLSIVTADNPRTEKSDAILGDIVPGLEQAGAVELNEEHVWKTSEWSGRFLVIEDRARAIRTACSLAGHGDCVIIAGKGHEDYQIVGREKRYFDDRREAVTGLLTWNSARLLAATGGRIFSGQQDCLYAQVKTDSRAVERDDIFIALRGEKFDGHHFIDSALEQGAAAVIVEEQVKDIPDNVLCIQVTDTLYALGELARYLRKKMQKRITVAAITGSSGKTSVKEMVGAIFAEHWQTKQNEPDRVLKTQGNFNNLIGLPLSLLPLSGQHEAVILEMGMNSPGEIQRLCEIADPDIGCINNIQAAHLEGLGTLEGVARAKGELFATMRTDAVCVVNYDDEHCLEQARQHGGEHVGFAVTPDGRKYSPAVRATRIHCDGEKGSSFTLQIEDIKHRVKLTVPGMHNVSNWVAATGIAWAAGVAFETIIKSMENYQSVDKRMLLEELPGGLRVVNDTYNANPSSMTAALRTVATFGRKCKRIAILGDMLELGKDACILHEQVGVEVGKQGYDYLAVIGEYADAVAGGARKGGMTSDQVFVFDTNQAAATWVYHLFSNGVLAQDDWLLIKGSRGMRMETTIEELRGQLNHEVNEINAV